MNDAPDPADLAQDDIDEPFDHDGYEAAVQSHLTIAPE
jgi:hypothetical protein